MNETKQKIMVIERRQQERQVLEKMLSPLWNLTIVDNAGEADKKAGSEDFDMIVTGCVLPQLSGKEGVLAFKTVKDMVAEEKAALLKNVRDAVRRFETDFQSKTSASEELLRQSQAQQDKIVETINGQLRQLEEEKIRLDKEIDRLTDEAETALKGKEAAEAAAETAMRDLKEAQKEVERLLAEKDEAERSAEAAMNEKMEVEKRIAGIEEASRRNIEALDVKVKSLTEDLNKTIGAAEAAIAEKTRAEEKLAQIQENWEKFVEGR